MRGRKWPFQGDGTITEAVLMAMRVVCGLPSPIIAPEGPLCAQLGGGQNFHELHQMLRQAGSLLPWVAPRSLLLAACVVHVGRAPGSGASVTSRWRSRAGPCEGTQVHQFCLTSGFLTARHPF
jgi:hypothetical protein